MVQEFLHCHNVKTLQEANALSISRLNHNENENAGPPLPLVYK